jgi:hypothetical protein
VTIPDRIEKLATREESARDKGNEYATLIREARVRNLARTIKAHMDVVTLGGGDYVPGMLGDLVLFNSPATGSTLAIKESELTAEAVREHIAKSNAAFGVL